MKPSRLYLMEYVLYHLRPSGIDDAVHTTG
ncbi:hypothetical protein EG68_08414 [Paragonimus skrjabini miyazakii]|uniref:Uncharacterized protein n=1 Tax=Paragonimus skrjabini miyazakii TaxID=59628 RepID=A0A8S9Y9F9_9TREM|nr:hypothetical protein EG68_08414 [Paragonimus skrjabini miyazakii]